MTSLRARLVYARILWKEFRASILAFIAVLALGTLATHALYDIAPLSLPEALWGTFTLIFFQPSLAFPRHPALEAVFFLIPVVSFLMVVEGFLRFGALVVNRNQNPEVWNMALAQSFENHVVIAGMGKIGLRAARLLLDDGERLVCVEKNPESLPRTEFEERGAALITGNILADDVFRKVHVEKAKCFMACTDDDLVNFESALKARAVNPGIRVVLRLFNDKLASQMESNFNISIVYSSSALAAPSFASAVYSKNIKDSFVIDHERFCLLHCLVDAVSPFCGLVHADVERQFEATIVVHKDSAKRKKPGDPQTPVEEGDNLILIVPFRVVKAKAGRI